MKTTAIQLYDDLLYFDSNFEQIYTIIAPIS